MKKLIKNYTTSIPSERTIQEIHSMLSANGARGIATEYNEDGTIKDVFFRIILNEKELPFRLPAKPDKVFSALFADVRTQWSKRDQQIAERKKKADAIAWRICKTWLEAQITLINLEQVKIEEVFLPYLVVGDNKTLYEKMKDNQFLLPSGE